jgi:hypothetical protein
VYQGNQRISSDDSASEMPVGHGKSGTKMAENLTEKLDRIRKFVDHASDALKNRNIILSEFIKLPYIFDSPLYFRGSIISGDTNVNNVVKVAGVCVRSIWALISGSNGPLCPLHENECCFDSVYTHL